VEEFLVNLISPDLFLAFLIVIFSGIIRGFTGFVAALVNIGLLSLLYKPVDAIALSSIFGLVSSVMLLRKTMNIVQWSEVIPLNFAAVLTIPLTALLLLQTTSSVVKPAIGAFLIACGLALIFGWKYKGPRNFYVAGIIGAAFGSVHGFTGASGPLMVFYFLASPEPVSTQRANINLSATVVQLVLILTLLWGNVINIEIILRAITLFPGVILGTWIGMRVFEVASDQIYKQVAHGALIAIGLALFLSGLRYPA